ncbi:MAG: ankyrin repeat domain-containing protein [Alphaproteobacteria bacterium]|nr:ankyrin repeat domain-containing protein [Alphaproteobacteria bacterium]MBN2675082.1 ankyrin repeat domain-containing protein [Alphaproteobacteria bacterium]
MKYIKIFLFACFFAPSSLFAANDFQVAAQLLSAAKNADIQQVQALVNNGANINYIDNTGLSVVCTALMNNDVRAAQILQMYGADASKCDMQIKRYNQKLPKEQSGGLFSGLSSAQSIALAAAGAAVVVGGLFFLTDMLDAGNTNTTSTTDGTRPGGDTTDPTTATAAFVLPYGPAMPNATSETANYITNLNYYSPSADGILKDNFALMTNTYAQNYLLMMHGYSPLARGYMGMRTLRDTTTRAPISLAGNNLGSEPVLGARPTNVALITTNGINATSKPAGEISETGSSLDDKLLLWTTTNVNGTAASGASNDMISSKYYNNKIVRGADNNSLIDDSTEEDSVSLSLYDLSGYGTVINNTFSTELDDLLAKVVGGKDTGYTTADYVGFMPNGQMTIFRTGGGVGMKTGSGAVSGTYTDEGDGVWGTGDTLDLFGHTLIVTVDSTGLGFTATDGTNTYNGYRGTDGLVYFDSDDDAAADQAYTIETGGDLILSKELGAMDYLNYKALYTAGLLWATGDLSNGRSKPDIVANASVIDPLHERDAATILDILSVSSTVRQTAFINLINQYYDVDTTDGVAGADALPGTDAASFFGGLGSSFSPITIFSTGAAETDSSYSGATLSATFENSAPLIFSNLEHLFMSVVAVGLTGTGTNGTTSVSSYSPSGKIALTQWHDTDADKYYKSRVCGIGGSGANGIDPWCFSAAGVTDELAVASMAGAVGVIKSAFDYLNNKQLFALLALTSDGPYLATNTSGTAITDTELTSYLKAMYQMPEEYQYRWEFGSEDYLDVFKEVFGYGLINLERATKPGSKIYYYDGTNIVSTSGDAYWRSASSTIFRSSIIFNPRTSSISAPFYDVLTSVDGTLSLPRIWENEFTLGTTDIRSLYMGDILGEFKVNKDETQKFKTGNMTFEMAVSEKPYADNMGGLDNLQFGYDVGNFELSAGYQGYFTDGVSRFDGTANPVLSLASHTVSSSAKYKFGNWSFGARGFSGSITDESLLENDPTVTNQYQPANLGLIQGAESNVTWGSGKFAITSSIGTAHETDTVLGAQTGGLLGLGQGDTTYIDTVATYAPVKDINFSLRSTFATTHANPTGEYILGMSDIESNAFSIGVDAGKFSFAIAAPLTITSGDMQYAYADYETVENADGNFDLIVNDTHIEDLNLSPENREIRFSGAYRVKLGTFTDGAFGFMYRVNPNNISEFGNESIFMMKFTHKVGI